MKIAIFKGKFDPLTKETVQIALNNIKKYNLQKLYFLVEEDKNCLVDLYHRTNIVKNLIRPYRKLFVINDINQRELKDKLVLNDEDLISSERVRNGDYTHLNKATRNYLISNGLYGQQLVYNKMYEKRYLHSLSVANLACLIAKSNGLDSFKAYLAGLYHDIAKCIDKQEITSYLNIYKPYEANMPIGVAHQYLAYYFLRHNYFLYDKTILKAVRHHCLGDNNDPYSMLLFIADKLDPNRGNDNKELIELACTNLKKAFKIVKANTEEYYK